MPQFLNEHYSRGRQRVITISYSVITSPASYLLRYATCSVPTETEIIDAFKMIGTVFKLLPYSSLTYPAGTILIPIPSIPTRPCLCKLTRTYSAASFYFYIESLFLTIAHSMCDTIQLTLFLQTNLNNNWWTAKNI